MIIICNQNEYEKKKLRKIDKFIISDDLKDVKESENVTHLKFLIPPFKLMTDFYNDDISEKKYYKKYKEYIEENDELMATIVTIMLIYKKEKNIAFVCSKQEQGFLYIDFIVEILKERYGIKAMKYSKWKDKDCPDNAPIDKVKLKKDVKKYYNLIFGEDIKKNKKSKKEDIEDDDFELFEEEVIKKIKVRRLK